MFMEWFAWGGFGLIVGSFLNVVILRHGVTTVLGRSACPSCGRTLEWFELVPVLSWLFLRGRCRTCAVRISLQYPLVELLTAAGFVAVGLAPVPLIERLIGVVIVALLIAISAYDIRHTLIPDRWSYAFSVLALIMAFSAPFGFVSWYMVMLAGPIVALPLFALWAFSGGKWMGFGDVKLALGIGWLLGILGGFVALMLGFMLGAFIGVCILLPLPYIVAAFAGAGITRGSARKTYTMKSEVPFGPFLICGVIIVWFSQLYGLGLEIMLVDFLSLS